MRRMPQLPAEFVLLNPSVYRSLVNCLKDLPMPRFSALFALADKTVAFHDGHAVTGIGPKYTEIFQCLEQAMGEKSDGVIVLDREKRQALWAPTADATEFLAHHNPPSASYLSDVKSTGRIVN
jgi:hypothetical protein